MKLKQKSELENEPSAEVIRSMKKKCWDEFRIKLSKKDIIVILEKTKEAKEAEEFFKKAMNSWPNLSKKRIEDYRKMLESDYEIKKKLSDFEINEMAQKLTIIAMVQRQREAGEAIRAILIKHKEIKIVKEDKEKLKKLFQIAFDTKLKDAQIEYYLKLSYWFVWYKEGLSINLSKALDNLLIHYDKKKRGKRGSLDPDDYDIGYFYRWIDYTIKNPKKFKKSNKKEFTLKQFIDWMDKEYQSARSFLAGNKCKRNKDGAFTMSVSLRDWE